MNFKKELPIFEYKSCICIYYICNFYYQEPARLNNHLRQTHAIKDDVLFKKLMKKAVPVMVDSAEPIEDDEMSGSEEELREYKDFKQFLACNRASEVERLESGEKCSDESDADWLEEEINKWGAWKNNRFQKQKEGTLHF